MPGRVDEEEEIISPGEYLEIVYWGGARNVQICIVKKEFVCFLLLVYVMYIYMILCYVSVYCDCMSYLKKIFFILMM